MICGLILNQLRHFNIRILNPAPQGNKKGFISSLLFKEALRLLRTNSSKIMFEEKITNFKSHLLQRGYPEDLINTTLSEVNFKDRKLALQQKQKRSLRILPFLTQYQPSVLDLKQILMKNWLHLIEQQPLLSEIYKNPPLISYKRGVRSRHTRESQSMKKAILNTGWRVV